MLILLLAALIAAIRLALLVTKYDDHNVIIKAANRGDAEAQYILSMMYKEGDRVPHDRGSFCHWLYLAAGRLHLEAMYELALHEHFDNRKVWTDSSVVWWLEQAAQRGHIKSQIKLLELGFNIATPNPTNFEESTINEDMKRLINERDILKLRLSKTPKKERVEEIKRHGGMKYDDWAISRRHILVDQVANEFKTVLARELRKCEYIDPYGNTMKSENYDKVLQYFFDNVILKRVRYDCDTKHLNSDRKSCILTIRHIAEEELCRLKAQKEYKDYHDGMSGVEYEHFCVDVLLASDWQVRTTKNTGDQGVDLIATQGNQIVAIQCKKSQTNIGNKAIQEIVAGAKHYGIDNKAVVSNAEYTISARALANTNGVLLLHHYDLQSLDALLKRP